MFYDKYIDHIGVNAQYRVTMEMNAVPCSCSVLLAITTEVVVLNRYVQLR